MNFQPKQINTSDHFWSSPFQNSECETILRNVVMQQKNADPDNWTPFTWEQYKSFCTHRVTDSEKRVLDVFVNGGKSVPNTSTYQQAGWMEFDGESYALTERTIEMLGSKYLIAGSGEEE